MTVITLIILIVYVLALIGLLYWALITAFKDYRTDFRYNTYGFPKVWAFNFIDVIQQISMPIPGGTVGFNKILINSLLYALGSAFFKTLVPCITAYACARYKFKFSKIIYTAVLIAMMIPVVGSLPSELKIAYGLGIYDTMWGAWILKANMLGLYFFVMHSAFSVMPNGYFEAAKIDGANNFQLMVRIGFPLIKMVFFTVLLINFVEFWNDYQTPLIYLPSHPTLGFTLFYVYANNRQPFTQMPYLMSTTIMVLLPVLILFIAFNKKLMGNLTMGGLKG